MCLTRKKWTLDICEYGQYSLQNPSPVRVDQLPQDQRTCDPNSGEGCIVSGRGKIHPLRTEMAMSSPGTLLPFAQEPCPFSGLFSPGWVQSPEGRSKRRKKKAPSAFHPSESGALKFFQTPCAHRGKGLDVGKIREKGWGHPGLGSTLCGPVAFQKQDSEGHGTPSAAGTR